MFTDLLQYYFTVETLLFWNVLTNGALHAESNKQTQNKAVSKDDSFTLSNM